MPKPAPFVTYKHEWWKKMNVNQESTLVSCVRCRKTAAFLWRYLSQISHPCFYFYWCFTLIIFPNKPCFQSRGASSTKENSSPTINEVSWKWYVLTEDPSKRTSEWMKRRYQARQPSLSKIKRFPFASLLLSSSVAFCPLSSLAADYVSISCAC